MFNLFPFYPSYSSYPYYKETELEKVTLQDIFKQFYSMEQDLKMINKKNYNYYATDKGMLFELCVPGYTKEQINVEYDPKTKSISVCGKTNNQNKKEATKIIDMFDVNDFCMNLSLKNAKKYDESKITSKLSNGILSITIPYEEKPEEEPSKKIPITI